MRHFAFVLLTLFLASCTSPSSNVSPTSGNADTNGPAKLTVISNRADLISGNDALIEVLLTTADAANGLVLTRNGTNISHILQPSAADPLRLVGVVDGLRLGDNTLTLNNGNSITVTNHPIGGPVFTGPHIQPWACQEGAADEQCNQPIEISWLYSSTNPTAQGLQPYDPENPATDIATTTTENGETLPFIVRQESGYQARDKYIIFNLFKPGEDWTPVNPQTQWNNQLLITHGGNCRGDHNTSAPKTDDYSGTIPANPLTDSSYITALGLGWSVLSTAQLNLGHNCNMAYQAESLMMAKERFIEQYGTLRYTVGTGCSGGAITQNMIANAYPGLYQGLLTTCTYPDVMSTATQFADYHILLKYFKLRVDIPEMPDSPEGITAVVAQAADIVQNAIAARDGTLFTPIQQNAIYGHLAGIVNASLADGLLFGEAVNSQSHCGGVTDEQRYHPETNPSGTRCDVLNFMENIVGPRERFDAAGNDRWSDIEKALGYGFAGFPLGNQGVQYGLLPLQQGIITPAQFLALNVNIGSIDMDLNVTPERLAPDYPALPNSYRSGIMNTIVNMDTVPIINMTGPGPGIAHDSVHGYWVRWRLDREFGHHDNFAHWGGVTPLIGDLSYMSDAIVAMGKWLDAIEADNSDTSLAEKILVNKPNEAQDQCNGIPGTMCPEALMLVFGTPRTEAGADKYGDQAQCQLRPFNRNDSYGFANDGLPLPFPDWTEEEWTQLEAAFDVNGEPMVCDWTKKPLEWQPTITWLTYQDQLGNMITGGEQMTPAEFPQGWASPSFSNTWEPTWQQ